MSILWILIPLSTLLLGVAIWGFFWAVDNDQFDHLDEEAKRILDEDTQG